MSESRAMSQAMANAFWDLRDHAYDHGGQWSSVTAEEVFQVIAAELELAVEHGADVDWLAFPRCVIAKLTDEGTTPGNG